MNLPRSPSTAPKRRRSPRHCACWSSQGPRTPVCTRTIPVRQRPRRGTSLGVLRGEQDSERLADLVDLRTKARHAHDHHDRTTPIDSWVTASTSIVIVTIGDESVQPKFLERVVGGRWFPVTY